MSRSSEREGDVQALAARVQELRAARAHPPAEYPVLLDAALAELERAVEVLRPAEDERARPPGVKATYPFRAVFEHLPWAVVLMDEQTVVRRVNPAAVELTGLPPGYAAGRPLAATLRPADRAALRGHAAAVARGEGGRSLPVRLQRLPDCPLHATLTGLDVPDGRKQDVLLTLTPSAGGPPVPAVREPGPSEPSAVVRQAELTALLDRTDRLLLSCGGQQDPAATLSAAAGLMRDGLADWAVLDLGAAPAPVRAAVHGPASPDDPGLEKVFLQQDPRACPVVAEAMDSGAAAVEQLTDDLGRLGTDDEGAPLMVRADVTSLLCVALLAPDDTTVLGALTLLRAGARPPFSLLEAGGAEIAAGHLAVLAQRGGIHGPGPF
ncbi:PAS domain-containing protein [Streptomyces sp. A0958]|uniref:PAS domain-containing protein n=1 Tax=Streptomyces sp. A0958 TaxID=2563101 RepID=UPI00109E40C8|nr:PAS domain-containing protein [Streptomyces sp. A0958]THA71196.1 PAS domain-containing protein [Streptomyces sp. A0958]